jgi:hypothetical protein
MPSWSRKRGSILGDLSHRMYLIHTYNEGSWQQTKAWCAQVAKKIDISFYEVDAHNVVPY